MASRLVVEEDWNSWKKVMGLISACGMVVWGAEELGWWEEA